MGEKRGMKALEAWCRKMTHGYRDVRVDNMTTAWRDGLAFCAILHHFRPDLIDFDSLSRENIYHNNNLAFSVAEHLGIPALLDAEDMVKYKVPDKLSILTYVSQLYQYFHDTEGDAVSPQKPSPKRPLEDKNDTITAFNDSQGKRSAVTSCTSVSSSASPSLSKPRRNDVCQACSNRVYILERLIVDNKLYHRACFKCYKCHTALHPGSYTECESDDQPDKYECVQCPVRNEEGAGDQRGTGGTKPFKGTNRLSREMLSRFSNVPAEDNGPKATSGTPEVQRPMGGSVPENATPVTDTGQAAPVEPVPAAEVIRSDHEPSSVDQGNLPVLQVPPSGQHAMNEADLVVTIITSPDLQNNNVNSQAPSVKPPLPPPSAVSEESAENATVAPTSVEGIPSEKCAMGPPFQGPPGENGESMATDVVDGGDGGTKPFPVAAPRIRKSKLADNRKEDSAQGEPSSENLRENPSHPVPRVRASVARGEQEPVAVVSSPPMFPPSPPKPPRSPHPSQDAVPFETNEEYPDHLNPFGDDDEKPTPESSPKKQASLNPFGDDDDEEEEEDEEPSNQGRSVEGPGQRRRSTSYDKSLNPFGSDTDSDGELSSQASSSSHVSTQRHSAAGIRHTLLDPSWPARAESVPIGARKKRPAPKPPSHSASSSPRITPSPSPRSLRKSPAPPPRPPPPALLSPRSSATISGKPAPPPPPVKRESLPPPSSPSFRSEKFAKELDNRNLSKATIVSAGRTSNGSIRAVSPNVLESGTSPTRSQLLPSSASPASPPSSLTLPNTFGYWKRKKKNAPLAPGPHRRQIQKLPLKEILSELTEIEEKQLELEKQGVELEKMIREEFSDDAEPSAEEEDLIIQLFELVNKKNVLFRRQAELSYLKRQQRLEEEHADLEYQIRCLLDKSADKKTEDDKKLEEQLLRRLVEVVKQRNEIIESMEMDRLREAEEDQSILERMALRQNQHRPSISSQGSLGSQGGGGAQAASPDKDKVKKKKKDKKKHKVKDEDKDTDEAEDEKMVHKDKKKLWFL